MGVSVIGRGVAGSVGADGSAPLVADDGVSTGFPSPAGDYVEHTMDLNELCVVRPAATFFVRVDGDSMIDAGIFHDDILVVDRSLDAEHGDVVIAALDGELTVRQLQLKPDVRLIPRNKAYSAILISEHAELHIFGVVTNVVRKLRQK